MNNFDTEYNKYNEELILWEQSICLSIKEPNRGKIEEVLDLTIEDIKQLETMTLLENCFVISQYLVFLQKKGNECDTFIRWSQGINKKLVGDEKIKCLTILDKVELRKMRVAYLSRRIEFMCQAISNIVRQRNLENGK